VNEHEHGAGMWLEIMGVESFGNLTAFSMALSAHIDGDGLAGV
jgi:hypothetical protein